MCSLQKAQICQHIPLQNLQTCLQDYLHQTEENLKRLSTFRVNIHPFCGRTTLTAVLERRTRHSAPTWRPARILNKGVTEANRKTLLLHQFGPYKQAVFTSVNSHSLHFYSCYSGNISDRLLWGHSCWCPPEGALSGSSLHNQYIGCYWPIMVYHRNIVVSYEALFCFNC